MHSQTPATSSPNPRLIGYARHDLRLRRADLQHLLALAQFERRLIQERTKAGLAAARARGRNGGRPKVTAAETKVVLAKKLHADKSLEIDDICQTLKMSRSTFYRYVRL